MKKISAFILSFCLLFSLSACSAKSDDEVDAFFKAFHNTLALDSGRIEGSLEMTNVTSTTIDFSLEYMQKDQLELLLDVSLSSGSNLLSDYLVFAIHDGKTYMDSMGTTSQSVAENIGISSSSSLASLDPFLDFSKSELASLFDSTHVSGDVYTMKINPYEMAQLLDGMGTVTITKADVTAIINHSIMESLTLYIEGKQEIGQSKANIKILLNTKLHDADTLNQISFPENLESFGS